MIAPLSEHVTGPQFPEDPDGILVYGKGSRFAKSFLIKAACDSAIALRTPE